MPPAASRRRLTLFDTTCIIVGIIIGSGLYEIAPRIAANVTSPAWLIGVWLLGGVFALIGALCYAELASAYPRDGGDYVYLTRAYGRPVGFLFAWAGLWIVRPGSIGSVAFIFARYGDQLWPLGEHALVIYAAGIVAVLTGVNILGVQAGKWTENVLVVTKVGGLLAIVAVAFLFDRTPSSVVPAAAAPVEGSFVLAMIFVIYAYGGWNDMALVGAEVRDPGKNVLRALLLGTATVTLVYLLVNLAFLKSLGFAGAGASSAIAVDVLAGVFPGWGPRAVALLICISAAGSINGMILTGSRVYFAMGKDHPWFAWLGRWNRRLGSPVASLAVQGAIALSLVIGFGLYEDGFQSLVIFSTPIFFVFFLLSGLSLFVLRWKEPLVPRPYRVLAYPLTPALFCLSTAFMIWASVDYAVRNSPVEALWSIGLLAVGAVLAAFSPRGSEQ